MTMDRETIIKLAREACMIDLWCENPNEVERFAKLVAEREREACAKVCDEYAELFLENDQAKDCADAIRARDNT